MVRNIFSLGAISARGSTRCVIFLRQIFSRVADVALVAGDETRGSTSCVTSTRTDFAVQLPDLVVKLSLGARAAVCFAVMSAVVVIGGQEFSHGTAQARGVAKCWVVGVFSAGARQAITAIHVHPNAARGTIVTCF